ncbi:MAG: virginiamycin B lyase family protein [Acidimicrobiales bacterium]
MSIDWPKDPVIDEALRAWGARCDDALGSCVDSPPTRPPVTGPRRARRQPARAAVTVAGMCALILAGASVGVVVTRTGDDRRGLAVTSGQSSDPGAAGPTTTTGAGPGPSPASVEVRQEEATVSAARFVPGPGTEPCRSTPAMTEYTFPGPGLPASVAPGEDGSVWFTDSDLRSIVHLRVNGAATRYQLPEGVYPGSIARGATGDLWFTDAATTVDRHRGSPEPPAPNIGRLTPEGALSLFPLPTREQHHLGGPGMGSLPFAITAGPDGAMWFTEAGADQIGRITADGGITEFPLPGRSTMHAHPTAIVTGPDGAIWFAQPLRESLGRIDVSTNAISEFPLPSPGAGLTRGNALTSGPAGSLWFDDPRNAGVGRFTPGAGMALVPLPEGSRPTAVVAGPDGNLWLIEGRRQRVMRVTPTGTVTEFPPVVGLAPVAAASPLTVASDGAVWFTTGGLNKLGRITCGRP